MVRLSRTHLCWRHANTIIFRKKLPYKNINSGINEGLLKNAANCSWDLLVVEYGAIYIPQKAQIIVFSVEHWEKARIIFFLEIFTFFHFGHL